MKGIKYGTIGIIINKIHCEITTFREDGKYINHRHPNEVIFTKDLFLDLKRRDFSINAIAYDILNKRLLDPFGGFFDIQSKIIKCIGNPYSKFSDDALRILRIFVLHAKLKFSIDESTLRAALELKHLLKHISKERIEGELNKLIASKNPKNSLFLLREYQIFDIGFIPSNFNSLPLSLRKSIKFLIFKDSNVDSNIFFNLHYARNTRLNKIHLLKLIYQFGYEKVENILFIKSSINKKYKKLKKLMKKNLILKMKINGFHLKKMGYKKEEIKIAKDYFAFLIIEKKISNNFKELFSLSRIFLPYLRKSTNDI